MGKTAKIEPRTKAFVNALDELKTRGLMPSNAVLAGVLEIPTAGSITEIRKFRQNIQPEAWGRFKAWYNKEFSGSDLSKLTLDENEQTVDTTINQGDNSVYNKRQRLSASLGTQAVANLTEANKLLAEAQKIFAESQRLFAESNLNLSRDNSDLISLVKASSLGETQTQQAFDAKYLDLLELLADVAAGKRYKSKQEVIALLSNMHYGSQEKKTVGGTQKN